MRPVLFALVLAATSALAQEASSAPELKDTPRSGPVLWVEPMPLVVGAVGYKNGTSMFYLPLGLSVPSGPTSAWTVELGYARGKDSAGSGSMYRALLGRSFSSKGPQQGFFVQPRLGLTLLHQDLRTGDGLDPAGTTYAADVGLDVGYQWRVGRLYLATMLGGSVGLAANAPATLGPMMIEYFENSSRRGLKPVTALNVNLLRVGFGT